MTLDIYYQLVRDAALYLQQHPPSSFVFGSYGNHQMPIRSHQVPTKRSKPKTEDRRLIHLETAGQEDQVIQNFKLESLANGDNHSHKVKAPSISIEATEMETHPAQTPLLTKKTQKEYQFSFSKMKEILQQIAPNFPLIDTIPGDVHARRICESWKERIDDTDVIILSLDQSEEEMIFLKHLAKAIQSTLKPTRILNPKRLEQENIWDLFLAKNTFRLIIASHGMNHYPHLMRHYTAFPAQGLSFLSTVPFISLSPAQTYHQFKDEKAALWKRICQILA